MTVDKWQDVKGVISNARLACREEPRSQPSATEILLRDCEWYVGRWKLRTTPVTSVTTLRRGSPSLCLFSADVNDVRKQNISDTQAV